MCVEKKINTTFPPGKNNSTTVFLDYNSYGENTKFKTYFFLFFLSIHNKKKLYTYYIIYYKLQS